MNDRDVRLDFVKGVLVIVMVLYHTINYFAIISPEDYGYIRFVTGAFIFISGYIISTIYVQKYNKYISKGCIRLITRGLKLIIIFTILNIALNAMSLSHYKGYSYNMQTYLNSMSDIYTYGTKGGAFQVLVPIGYLLILASLYMLLLTYKKAVTCLIIAAVAIYSFFEINAYNLNLLVIGLVGLSVGSFTNLDIKLFIDNRALNMACLALLISSFGYLTMNLLSYSFGVLLVIKFLFDFANLSNLKRSFYRFVVLLGQYSLACYIVQIVFLYGLFRILHYRSHFGYQAVLIFMATNLSLVGFCMLASSLRKRYSLFDRTYQFIFA